MHTLRFTRHFLALLLCAWLGGLPGAHAGMDAAGHSMAEPPPADVAAERAGAPRSVAGADLPPPAGRHHGRILFILASSKVHGTSTIPASISFGEVVHAWDVFQAAGYAVDFVSPDGGDLPILDAYVGEEVAARLDDDRIMAGLRHTLTPAQVDPARYRAVYYVGGSNAMYGVAGHPVLQAIAMHVYERDGGVISAVCHGTAGIVDLRLASGQYLVAGRRISGYPEEHEQQDAAYFRQFPFLIRRTVQARGGVFNAIDSNDPYIEIDGRLVTGQNYASAAPVAEAVVELLRRMAGPPPATTH